MNHIAFINTNLLAPIVEGMQARWREAQDSTNEFERAYGFKHHLTQAALAKSRLRYEEMREVEKLIAEARSNAV